MEMNIRKATIVDLDQIVELWRELSIDQLGKDSYYEGSLKFNTGYGQIKNSLLSDDCGLFVVEYDNEIKGFIEAWVNRFDFKLDKNDSGYIVHYYIKESGRNRTDIYKIITELYYTAEEWVKSKGKQYVVVDTFAFNERIRIMLKRVKVNIYKTRMVREI